MQARCTSRPARIALALLALTLHAAAAPWQAPSVGSMAPEIRLDAWIGVEPGEEPSAERLRGKVVMIEFWGTWCAPCVQAMPHVQALHDRYGELGLVVLAISNEAREAVEPFVRKHGYTLRFGCDPQMDVVRAFGVGRWPTTFLIGEDGRIIYIGIPTEVEPAIERALGLPADAAGGLNAYVRALAQGDEATRRGALRRLIDQRPRAFDLARWARVAPRLAEAPQTAQDASPAAAAQAGQPFDCYVQAMRAGDAQGVRDALALLAESDARGFDLLAWARAAFREEWPIEMAELDASLAAKRFPEVAEALLHRAPTPQALAHAAADAEFAAYCGRRAPEARGHAKQGLMLEHWLFANVEPRNSQAFWSDLGVAGVARVDEHGAPAGVTIGGELVTRVSAGRFVTEELSTSLALSGLASGREPAASASAAIVEAQRAALLESLRRKYGGADLAPADR